MVCVFSAVFFFLRKSRNLVLVLVLTEFNTGREIMLNCFPRIVYHFTFLAVDLFFSVALAAEYQISL